MFYRMVNEKRYACIDCTINVQVDVYDGCKYDEHTEEIASLVYENVTEWGVFNKADFKEGYLDELINDLGEDEFDEYLKIWMADGETATFRNSNVDMFRLCVNK